MNVLVAQAQSNFSNGTAERPVPGAEKCTMARSLSGANVYHCAWSFSYRDGAAKAAFAAFNRELPGCFGNSAVGARDQRVNHPDFYDQRQYHLDRVLVTVSIKDKAALQRTYVFIGVQGAIPD